MSIKKNVIKIIIGIIVAIAVIVGGIFAFQFISTNSTIKDTEEKLSQIDAKELENKLIEELKNTKLYVGAVSESDNELVWTEFKNVDGVVMAKIQSTNEEYVNIPCFKIESDSNGKFKSITFDDTENNGIFDICRQVIKNEFKNKYNIDTFIKNNSLYNNHFRKVIEPQKIETSSQVFFESMTNHILGYVSVLEWWTPSTFGI